VKLGKNKKLIKRIIIGVLTSVIIALILMYRYHLKYFYLKLITPKVNIENEEKYKDLHPVFKYHFYKFLKTLEKQGVKIIATSGYRSIEKQNELYNAGITNTKGGYSTHNFGIGADLNLITPEGVNLKMATSKNKWLDTIQGFESFGLRWGGNFSGFYDPVHFDIKDKFPDLEYLRMLYSNNDLVNKKFVKI
jgi:peptidoglycan L-alanyl-D-glutamate endopeptidase CwlK